MALDYLIKEAEDLTEDQITLLVNIAKLLKMQSQPAKNEIENPWSVFDELRAEAQDLPEMTLDEINAEIAAARAERKKRQ